ncbi:MAG: 5'-methylthioadenosine/adenosylhomocysteine nucleosidase [Ruminococcaceae bacterium]|nr:5'-methylthioadenosine/adenosylhomocysteine nucleosidase [Oscillospiraceae bacterium]
MSEKVLCRDVRTVGFVCPMDCELNAVTCLFDEKKEVTYAGMDFYEGQISGHPCVAVKCGVGKVFAALAAQAMILGFRPDLIINTGVAGNLSDDLSIGDVVVSSAVVQHDMDTSPLGDPVGLISGINKVLLESDGDAAALMRGVLKEMNVRHAYGVVASGDQFVATAARRDFIRDTFGALCCEMEGAAVGQACYALGVPFLVLRALSDDANGNSPDDFPAYCVKVSETSSRAIAAFMKALA